MKVFFEELGGIMRIGITEGFGISETFYINSEPHNTRKYEMSLEDFKKKMDYLEMEFNKNKK